MAVEDAADRFQCRKADTLDVPLLEERQVGLAQADGLEVTRPLRVTVNRMLTTPLSFGPAPLGNCLKR